jgi:hypothetical protein
MANEVCKIAKNAYGELYIIIISLKSSLYFYEILSARPNKAVFINIKNLF